MELQQIDLSKVVKVYEGREGCRCGCLGEYYYSSGHMEVVEKEKGTVNDDKVKEVVDYLNECLKRGLIDTGNDAEFNDQYINYTTGNNHSEDDLAFTAYYS